MKSNRSELYLLKLQLKIVSKNFMLYENISISFNFNIRPWGWFDNLGERNLWIHLYNILSIINDTNWSDHYWVRAATRAYPHTFSSKLGALKILFFSETFSHQGWHGYLQRCKFSSALFSIIIQCYKFTKCIVTFAAGFVITILSTCLVHPSMICRPKISYNEWIHSKTLDSTV